MGRSVDFFFSFTLFFFFILVVSNRLLVKMLISTVGKADQNLSSGQSDRTKTRERKASSVTLTFVIVSILFILLCLPFSLFLIVNAVVQEIPEEDLESPALKTKIIFFPLSIFFGTQTVLLTFICIA